MSDEKWRKLLENTQKKTPRRKNINKKQNELPSYESAFSYGFFGGLFCGGIGGATVASSYLLSDRRENVSLVLFSASVIIAGIGLFLIKAKSSLLLENLNNVLLRAELFLRNADRGVTGINNTFGFGDIKLFARLIRDESVDKLKSEFSPGDGQINVDQLTSNVVSYSDGFNAGNGAIILGEYSPLAIAILCDKIDMVKTLIDEYGADPNFKSGRDKDRKKGIKGDYTAFDVAKRWGTQEIIEYLDTKKVVMTPRM